MRGRGISCNIPQPPSQSITMILLRARIKRSGGSIEILFAGKYSLFHWIVCYIQVVDWTEPFSQILKPKWGTKVNFFTRKLYLRLYFIRHIREFVKGWAEYLDHLQ